MPLLAEYALTPDIFDRATYAHDEIGTTRLQHLKEVLLSEGLVRNLCDGAWLNLFSKDHREWHIRGKELLKKLVTQGRVRIVPRVLLVEAETDFEWSSEALASHGRSPLHGVIVGSKVAAEFSTHSVVSAIDRLPSAGWWTQRESSVRLRRSSEDYTRHLHLLFETANSIMVIDPHLDPTKAQYSSFIDLIAMAANRSPAPRIEVHRVCYVGSGPQREIVNGKEWINRFRAAWSTALEKLGLSVEVFIWDDAHDRYLISDLVGIISPNGFDTSDAKTNETTWARLGRKDRDDVQREFDPASNRHFLHHRFTVC